MNKLYIAPRRESLYKDIKIGEYFLGHVLYMSKFGWHKLIKRADGFCYFEGTMPIYNHLDEDEVVYKVSYDYNVNSLSSL